MHRTIEPINQNGLDWKPFWKKKLDEKAEVGLRNCTEHLILLNPGTLLESICIIGGLGVDRQ